MPTIVRFLLGGALALAPVFGFSHAARASGVVTDCVNFASATGLGPALAAAGNITFSCAGTGPFTIIVPTQTEITSNTSIDGSDGGKNDVTLSGNDAIRLFQVHAGATLTIANLTIAHANATPATYFFNGKAAGAIANLGGTLIVTNSTFDHNHADGNGGAIVTLSNLDCGFNLVPPAPCPLAQLVGGTTIITNSRFTNNTAGGQSGAIQMYALDTTGAAEVPGNTLTIRDSTFSSNTSTTDGGVLDQDGGAITVSGTTFDHNTAGRNGGVLSLEIATVTTNKVTISNSTFTANTATTEGGAIFNAATPANLTLVNDTINGNSTTAGMSGGLFLATPGTTTIQNSILASNLPFNCNGVGAAEDGGFNLEFPALTCNFANNNQTGDPKLGPLASNGGPTQTEALLTGSAAIAKGSAAICAAAPVGGVDQRGLPRYEALRGVCDIGAYDTGGGIVPPLTLTGAIPLTTGVPARLGFAASNHTTPPLTGVVGLQPFNIGYITFQLGASTFTVRQPVTIACTSAGGLDHCFGTTGLVNGLPGFVAVPGTATVTLSGTISSARGAYQLGQTATVTLSISASATGVLTVSKVTVAVAGVTVATWTSLPAGTSLQIDKSAPLIV